MKSLINFLSKEKQHWLTVPRFAVVVLPIPVSSVFSLLGYSALALVPLAVSVIAFSRLVWFKLIPHEKRSLAAGQNALAAMWPDKTISILQNPLRFGGVHYKLCRAILLSRAYCSDGMFAEAHAVLSTVDETRLLQNELLQLKTAWAKLFLEAGNLKEAARRLEDVSNSDCVEEPECLLVNATVKQEQGCLSEARELLEAGLDRYPKGNLRVRLLNNLALVELLQGRTDAQLRHLQAALVLFRNNPCADLTSILHHNLAIALARAGQPNKAREVLREAWAAGDQENFRHVLEVLNNNLHTAREMRDQGWKVEVYEEFNRQLKRFDSPSPRGRLALDVTQLRMSRNDGFPLGSINYTGLISRLLDGVSSPLMAIPERDRVAALCEICHDLKREMESSPLDADVHQKRDLLQRASELLLEKRPVVDAYLASLSPKLIGPLNAWHGYRTSMDKAEIYLSSVQDDGSLRFAHDQLFQHLQERAEWLTEQESSSQSIEAWLVICDEYLAYQDQLPAHDRPEWCERYFQMAESALDRLIALLDTSKNERNHIAQMIGAAYFSLRLSNDKATAERYMAVVKKNNPSMDHFATWLRGYYRCVHEQLGWPIV